MRAVSTATAAWIEAGREHVDLARGARLETAARLADQRPELLNGSEAEWVAASRAAAEAEVASQAEAAARDRRQNRRLRQLLAVGAVLLVVAVIAAAGALVLRNRSVDSEQAAVTARSEAEANAQLAEDNAQRAAASEQAAVAAQTEAEANAQQALDAEQRALVAQDNAEIERLTALSAAKVTVSPDVAILLALEANRRRDDIGTQSAVQQAIGTQPALTGVFPNPLDAPSFAVFSRDANVGVAWTRSGIPAIQFFDSKSGELLGDRHETDAGVQWLAVSDDGKVAAVALLDATIRFMSVDGADVAPPFPIADTALLEHLSLDRTGRRLLHSSAYFVEVVDVGTGTVLSTYEPFDESQTPRLVDLVGKLSSDGSFFVAEFALDAAPEGALPRDESRSYLRLRHRGCFDRRTARAGDDERDHGDQPVRDRSTGPRISRR